MDRPRHFDGRSRLDPLPPPPHFAVPNYHPHHHLRPPLPPPHPFPPHPPPPIYHDRDRDRDRDRGPPVDHRRYFPFSDPPPFDHHPPRVPDRLLYHEHHPSPRHRGEPLPRDPWCEREPLPRDPWREREREPLPRDPWRERERAPDANRFNLFNQSPYPIRSEWEHDARSPHRDPPYPPADPRRKRPRWDQGPDLDADDDFRRGCQRRVELLDDQPRHVHHVQVHQPRTFSVEPPVHQHREFTFGVEPQIHRHRQFPIATEPQIRQRRDFPFGTEPLIHGHRDFTFGVDPHLRGHCDFTFGVEQAPANTSFVAEESTSSPMVSRLDFVPSRGGGGEAPLILERQQTPPSFRPAARSYSHMEISNDDMSLDDHDYQEKQFVDDHGYQENHSAGNRGKKGLGRGYNKDYMGTPRKQKPSALSRIQSGKSVWERIEERPAFLSPPSPPLPSSPLPNLPPPSFSEEEHPLEIDALDLSYRSNASKAKVISSPSPVAPSSDGKPPNTTIPIAKKKKIKKKIVKTRARVVVPIVPSSKGPALTEGLLKTSVSTRLHQLSGQVEASTEAIVSSGNTATSASPQSFLKTTVKTASVGKSATRNSATKIDINKGACGEDKAVAVNEESRKYAEVFLSEISSQLCQRGSLVAATTEKSSVKQSSRTDNSFEAGYNMDISEVECAVSGKIAVPDCTVPIGSFVGVGGDASLQMCAQTEAVVVAAQENIAAKGPFKVLSLVEDKSTADPVKQPVAECDVNPVVSDFELTMSSPKKESPVPLFGDETRVVTSVGSVIFSSSVDSLKGKKEERKRDEGDELQQLSICKVTEGLDGRQSEYADSCFDSNLKSVDLKPETKDGDLDRTPFGGPKGDDDHDLTLQVRDERDSDYINLRQDHSAVHLIDSMDEMTEQPLASRRSKVDSQIAELSHLVSAGPSHAQLSDSKRISDTCYNNNQADLPSMKLFASEEKAVVKSNKPMPLHLPFLGKVQPSSLHQHTKPLNVVQRVAGVEPVRKTSVSSGIPRFVPKASLAGSTKQTERTSLNVRNKTWHRDSTPSASFSQGNLQGAGRISMHKQSPKKLTRPQSSYIRKGNSLIRNSAAEVHPPKQSHDLGVSGRVSRHATKRSTGDEIKVGRNDSATGSNLPFERPKTPPLPLCTKLTNCTPNLPSDCSHPTSKVQNPETDDETRIGQLEIQALDLLSGTTDSQNLELSKAKRMTYVKHKSNQLVAAPRPESGDSCNHPADNTQMLASFTSPDIYYRRKKHQLVRNASTSDVQLKQNAISSLDNSNSDDQRNSMVLSMKSSTASLCRRRLDKGRRLDKVLQKTYKHPKFSLVWTLNGENSNKKGVTSSNRWKVLPHLFPWKRTIYRRNYPSNTIMSNKLPLPLISRKLQLTRKRNAIYKVSTDGFSLRKTGVVSIGGTSLKWSKSIEKHSKKVSKEATLAVAEAERNKRERERTSVGANIKNGRSLPRERIFRVGSARYKMDSSRRTLIRIPDEQSSCAIDLQSGNNCQASFVPRRLLIGNDEYIRIGNGNQLVRDPKKLIRILASEKVRWSLHTARLRLAKKHQYCQFFTRFGKCNKNGGKCPYIHDPAKIAICTKFLRGLCSNTDCKLTHKVLPERMPDCSYYLQGLCTNINCPYRHVNVNPKASVCEGFLKGYCADGDECDKKHSYVCPIFEATGKCLHGSKCKLHHPKKKSKRRKQPEVQSNNRGRYFGCSFLETGEPLIVVSDKHDSVEKARDVFYSDGHFTDYIPVDIGSHSNVETDIPVDSLQTQWASDLSEMHPDDLDALIKPIRIMKKANLTIPSSGP